MLKPRGLLLDYDLFYERIGHGWRNRVSSRSRRCGRGRPWRRLLLAALGEAERLDDAGGFRTGYMQ